MPTLKWAAPGPSDPTLEGWQSQLFNQSSGIGKAGRYYKNILKALQSGEDYSNLPGAQALSSEHANQRQGIEEGYMTGGNVLLGAGGGEDALVLNRMREYEGDKQRAREGQDYEQYAANLSDVAGQGFQRAFDSRNQLDQQAHLGAVNNRLGYFTHRNQPYMAPSGWDKFKDIAGMVIGGATAAGGLGYKPGGH